MPTSIPPDFRAKPPVTGDAAVIPMLANSRGNVVSEKLALAHAKQRAVKVFTENLRKAGMLDEDGNVKRD